MWAAGAEDETLMGDTEQLEPAPDVEGALRILETGGQLPLREVPPVPLKPSDMSSTLKMY